MTQWVKHFTKIFKFNNSTPLICHEAVHSTVPVDSFSIIKLNAPISRLEVNIALSKVKTNKASGPDKIPNELLKHIQNDSIDFFKNAFNILFETH